MNNENTDLLNVAGLSTEVQDNYTAKYLVTWPDNTFRWMFSIRGLRPGYLSFVQTNGYRDWIKKWLIIFRCKVVPTGSHRIKRARISIEKTGIISKALETYQADDWDVFFGSPGPNRNIVVALYREKQIVSYLKIPLAQRNNDTQQLVEHANYEYFSGLMLNYTVVPKCDAFETGLVVAPVVGQQYSDRYIEVLVKSLAEMSQVNKSSKSLESYLKSIQLFARISTLLENPPLDPNLDSGKIRNILNKIRDRVDQYDLAKKIDCSIGIVDFTPWNSFIVGNKIALIDLEFTQKDVSLGYDLFHFFCQSWIMSRNVHKIAELSVLLRHKIPHLFALTYEGSPYDIGLYADLYTIQNSIRMLEIYSRQQTMHKKGLQQIDLWQQVEELWSYN